ncbi:type II toxin-antitoxin system prevent-host-death family antitoxin [Curtanaerobium respiraculi]|uniref:type II toxin-antitoxin system prevent-host-death family antitoxin n=1 Tax=Curtanaerobium respiraculi TaxID=2949669 RepID=UPI0024B35328|nr:type II toxin-antitoxin system prevent-host-death family antitoxin [Curtanaerobium respiraculi]
MAEPAPLYETRPISDLRTKLNDIEEHARTSKEPIVLTRNGKPSLIVMDGEAYEERRNAERFTRALREAEIEAKYRKKTVSLAESKQRVESIRTAIEMLHA